MPVSREVLTAMGATRARAETYVDALNSATAAHGIDNPLRMAHFLAQLFHESGGLRHVVENMNYSADGLMKIFRRHFHNHAEAETYARKPEKIGSKVYGGRMGNGDEASGDGYRYRGRGLIQLTGKNNYRAFSQWVGEDVVANPDMVSEKYAVHSAVFFWETNALSALADTDDLRAITRRINGGLNGFADRRELLEKAKAALEVEAVAGENETAGPAFDPTHVVTPPQLNLRSAPRVASSTWLAALAQHSKVEVRGEAEVAGWVKVRVLLGGALRDGFLASRFLAALPRRRGGADAVARSRGARSRSAPPPVVTPVPVDIPAVHLSADRREVKRARAGGWAYPLGEARRPSRGARSAAGRAAQVLKIVDYLDSPAPAHGRYQSRSGSTYGDVYASDLCYLAGVYLPRVWWTGPALMRIATGEAVEVAYARTVREVNANALHDWLEDHGTRFGWHREIDLTTLQAAANAGEVCLIVATRRDLNRSGHIVAVVPEHEGAEARRNAAGEVLRPLESQAGTKNFRYAVSRSAWWQSNRFQSFAFWRHP